MPNEHNTSQGEIKFNKRPIKSKYNILDMPHEHQTSQGLNIQLNTYRTKMRHIR
jgi:hypothetical protein